MNRFSNISNITTHQADELNDAFEAVEKANAWEWLKNPETPGNSGFMLCEHPMLATIHSFMTVGHSGYSFSMAMRHMESIAKKGWDGYLRVLNAND